MTTIDDSNNTPASTPPGYWFGEIESRLRDRMRSALAEQDLRRGGWRLLHTLNDGPASADELAARLPRGRRGRGRSPERDARGHDSARRGRDRSGSPERGERDHHHGHDGFGRGGHHPSASPRPQGAWTSSRETWHAERPFGPGGGRPDHRGADAHAETYAPAEAHGHDGKHGHEHHGHHDHHDREAAFERGFERGFLRGTAAAPAFGGPFGGPGGFRGGRGFGPHRGHGGPHGRCDGDRRTARIERILADFTERGWVWFDGESATLTDEGRAAHDAAFARVQEVRAAATDGISAEDYATTLSTLERMARNLGWEPRDPEPGDEPGTRAAEERQAEDS
ncbi:hypothetical protein LLS1_04410 [Leifsonia sp. LS1]|uniref:hypothetical protein n=1 Tax=Leifsonia sp. LS1 TaxID=2828483 RepID=UPI001CFD91B8|nr:hypothetical protein [Leifsonia sp. LS1]GIT78772.1 hypothetical protein LLS1_04410 [Leifsonia sp. LS1]